MKAVYTLDDLRNGPLAIGEKPIRLGVVGDPIAHSRSPQMHQPALDACGLAVAYARFHLREEELAEALPLFSQHGFVGLNVTIPHKTAVLDLLDEIDPHAKKIGAVNTIRFEEGTRIGFNTDGPGLVRAIRSEFGVDLRDLRVIVLGAGGGAGRAIAAQCAIEGCQRLVLVNRTFEKAARLAADLEPYFEGTRLLGPHLRLEAVPWESARLAEQIENADLVINATSCGMKRTDPSVLPASILQPHLMVYDTIYTARRTPLLSDVAEAGARGANGLSMLLHQGALSFEIWFDRDAPLETMRHGLLSS